MSENETPKDEGLNEEASLDENSGSADGAGESVEIPNDDAEGPDEGNQEPVSDIAVAAAEFIAEIGGCSSACPRLSSVGARGVLYTIL